MIYGNPMYRSQSILSLQEVVRKDSHSNLIPVESIRNISDNIVLILELSERAISPNSNTLESTVSGTSGTGFQITTDGFIVTAYHVIKPHEDNWKKMRRDIPNEGKELESWINELGKKYWIVNKNGESYPIDITFLETDPSNDIAIIKAIIPEKPKPIKFNILFNILYNDLSCENDVSLLAVYDYIYYNNGGKVIIPSHNIYDFNHEEVSIEIIRDVFLTDVYSIPGFSGGVFLTSSGEFAGICLHGATLDEENIFPWTGGCKAKYVVDLIDKAAHNLNNSD